MTLKITSVVRPKIVRQEANIGRRVVKRSRTSVVKSGGIVLLGNITSNVSLLMAEGVGINDLIRHHLMFD